MDGPTASRRDPTLDVARGLAVLLMVWVHFVPDEGPWTSVWGLDALPAALFTMLVGVSAAVGPAKSGQQLLRRVAALCCIGLPFWVWVWSNDILLPIACMSVAAAWCRAHPARTWCALALLCLAVPCATELWGGHAWTDIREDGTHEANHSPGWHTLRYFLLDGAYPLLPWAAFPLLGLRFAAARGDRPRLRRWLFGGLLAAAVGLLLDRFGDAAAGGFAVHLDVT